MTTIERLWAQLDALRHLSPVHPARQAALDAIWFYHYPDWVDEAEADPCPF